MSALTALARLRALREGRAQPVATVRHCHVAERPMVFVPLRLAGEAAAPLAALVGADPAAPRLLVVPQPRDRGLRFAFAAELAEVLLPYLEGFGKETETVERRGAEPQLRCADAPQIVVPNRRALEFTGLLGRSTRFRRPDGPFPVHPSVPVLGRWLTFFADRAAHPGSSLLLAATDALTLHWASGQSEVEDANLAALLGWIDPPPGMTGVQAALAAEDPRLWPPAGPDTDPGFDNEVLAPAIAAYDEAPPEHREHAARRIREALRTQVEPAWRLLWRAVGLLRGLPEGASVARRWARDRGAFTDFRERIAQGAPPQPRRDGAVAAAARLARLERTRAAFDVQRAYDDPLVMAEYRLTGEAFAGRVVAADPDRTEGEGRSRKLRPLVTITTDDPVRLAPGTVVGTPERRGQEAEVVEVDGGTVTIKITKGMGRGRTPAPGAVPKAGERVCYTSLIEDSPAAAALPEPEETPWTHGGPPADDDPEDEE